MAETRYTVDHEWLRVEGEIGIVGITDYAQEQLGDIVFVELPEIGSHVERGGDAAVVESVKAASEVYAPVAGEIVEINTRLSEEPAIVNSDPAGDGWFFKIRMSDPEQTAELMSSAQYKEHLGSLD